MSPSAAMPRSAGQSRVGDKSPQAEHGGHEGAEPQHVLARTEIDLEVPAGMSGGLISGPT
jgi:hypothetical protein